MKKTSREEPKKGARSIALPSLAELGITPHQLSDAKSLTVDKMRAEYFTVDEAAAHVRTSPATIRLHLTKGKLRRFKYFHRTLILRSQLEELIHEA